MKKSIKLFGIFFLFLVYSCSKQEEIPADVQVNDFIWKGLNAYYLHQDQIPNLSDRRFSSQIQLNSYLKGFSAPDLFSSLLISSDIKSRLIEDYTTLTLPQLRSSNTHGVEFGLIAEPNHPDNLIGFVQYILPNSDATNQNIMRGEFFNSVDGTQLTRDNYENLLLNNTVNSFTINMVDFDGIIVTSNAKDVVLTRQTYNHPAIFMEKVFTNGTTKTGYLIYNNDFSSNYISNLNNTFLNFKNQSINQLVIDLRYNIGGDSFVKTTSQIASMITGQFANQPFLKEKWNIKAQPWFEANQPDSLITKFPTHLNPTTPINGLSLTDVYIILNRDGFRGSSTIELLINSLKPYINVHVIGNQTSGNNTGSITLYNSVDYDSIGKSSNHTYAIQPIVLSYLNKNNETYENGISPTMQICSNEDILNLGVLGETTDPLLNRVLNFVENGTLGNSPLCNPFDFEYIFNSTSSQQTTDRGVFIEQDLPNTL